jgi:NAD(P)-dependent dehydrogenase (short-subunit alcohol dehydrogenase family)
MATQKVWLITGASKGFGFEFVKAALAQGDQVIATVRNQPEDLAATLGNNPNLLPVVMDVTNEAQVKDGVQQGIAHFGRLDIVVNNAGYGLLSGIEESSDAETRQQYDTNVFGLLNVTRAVLPTLRKQRAGHLINISSLFGYDAKPGLALYGSTKFAVEGLSKGLALELAPFGIKVTAAAPGVFSTDFLSKESYRTANQPLADYDGTPAHAPRQASGHQPGDPAKLAQVIMQVAASDNPPLHLPIGPDAVAMYEQNVAKVSQEVAAWRKISISTNHAKA